jgi:hypothetical protein
LNSCCYEIDEILNEAIITGVPALIVEGIDDISIYDNLASKVPFEYEIYAIENIEGFGEGCDQVILAVKELNTLESSIHALADHMLGIIDKDVRDFRQEIPQIEPILVLNHYSIESHFVSKAIVKQILTICSKANRELITEELCDLIMDEIEIKLLDLYYFSLEALKNSLEPEYSSIFSYSNTYGRMKDQVIRQSLNSKKSDLDVFALQNNLSPCLDTLKSISKGKWLIDIFANELLDTINNLPEKCRQSLISNCKSCITGTFHKCLYRINDGFTNKSIKSLALSNTNSDEFDYIVERISKMKVSA